MGSISSICRWSAPDYGLPAAPVLVNTLTSFRRERNHRILKRGVRRSVPSTHVELASIGDQLVQQQHQNALLGLGEHIDPRLLALVVLAEGLDDLPGALLGQRELHRPTVARVRRPRQ